MAGIKAIGFTAGSSAVPGDHTCLALYRPVRRRHNPRQFGELSPSADAASAA
jgi:hypothetical protein